MTEKSFSSSDALILEDNFKRISHNIENAAAKAGRTDRVRLMAVTKTVPPERINHAISLGADLLGENRVQEFMGKYEFYDKKCEIHFIGGLQNNKVKYIIDKVSMIHSVDSVRLAEEINKRAAASNRIMDILIEVNIGGEESKGGVTPEAADELSAYCIELANVRLRGYMTIPPPSDDSSRYFAKMQELYLSSREKYDTVDTLSMGMSGDYEQAVLFGSNIVRIGSALFGSRK